MMAGRRLIASIASITGLTKPRKEKLVRTTVTIPASLKERMSRANLNWSEVVRETINQRLEEQEGGGMGGPDMAEAVILNERAKRAAPKGWDSLEVIKRWRRNTS